ncbi:hypothetical protein TNCV_2111151 [Trichonephila clavipes]|nr:hypothetical protein TNCV_2111151 [Trichonephila clavipes]
MVRKSFSLNNLERKKIAITSIESIRIKGLFFLAKLTRFDSKYPSKLYVISYQSKHISHRRLGGGASALAPPHHSPARQRNPASPQEVITLGNAGCIDAACFAIPSSQPEANTDWIAKLLQQIR